MQMEKTIFEGKPSSKLELCLLMMLWWLVFPIYIYGKRILVNITTQYRLSTKDFFHRCGIFSIEENHLELARIRDIKLEQPFLIRILGMANIVLFTSDETSPRMVIRQIQSDKARQIIEEVKPLIKSKRGKSIQEIDFR